MSGKKEDPEKIRRRWIIFITIFAFFLSVFMSTFSDLLMRRSTTVVAFIVLIGIVLIGIVFDVIGVAVTVTDEKPFHSMAAHRERGAKEALRLLKNADRVSSICNDVVGDICGIVSGATSAVIVARLQTGLNVQSIFISVGVTALVSGLTIGGKAMCKPFAIKQSKQVVYWAGRFLHLFHRS